MSKFIILLIKIILRVKIDNKNSNKYKTWALSTFIINDKLYNNIIILIKLFGQKSLSYNFSNFKYKKFRNLF